MLRQTDISTNVHTDPDQIDQRILINLLTKQTQKLVKEQMHLILRSSNRSASSHNNQGKSTSTRFCRSTRNFISSLSAAMMPRMPWCLSAKVIFCPSTSGVPKSPSLDSWLNFAFSFPRRYKTDSCWRRRSSSPPQPPPFPSCCGPFPQLVSELIG